MCIPLRWLFVYFYLLYVSKPLNLKYSLSTFNSSIKLFIL